MAKITFRDIKRVLGIEDYYESLEIIEYLEKLFPDYTFNKVETVLLEDDGDIKIWIITSTVEIFIIKDDGFKINILFKRPKNEFKYSFIRESGKQKIYIEETTTPIPINLLTSGGTQTIMTKLEKFKQWEI